jgi:hypothetical protein
MTTDTEQFQRALADLATTMTPNPERLRQVRHRVERQRRRRVATGAAVSAGAVAATLGLATIPRTPKSAVPSASSASSVCSSVPQPVPQGSTLADVKTPDGAVNEPAASQPDDRFKGYAVVGAVAGDSITLQQLTSPGPLPANDSVVVVADASTTVLKHAQAAALADVAVGQRVFFSIARTDAGTYRLEYVELDVADPPAVADPQVVDAKRAAAHTSASIKDTVDAAEMAADAAVIDAKKRAAAAAVMIKGDSEVAADGTLEGKGVVESASADELVVVGALGQAGAATVQLRIAPDTSVTRYETPCAIDAESAGTSVIFSARDNGDGTFTATKVQLFD